MSDQHATVEEYLAEEKINLELIEERSDSEYWQSSYRFVLDNIDREVRTLSYKQHQWLDKIRDDMTEWRIKNRK